MSAIVFFSIATHLLSRGRSNIGRQGRPLLVDAKTPDLEPAAPSIAVVNNPRGGSDKKVKFREFLSPKVHLNIGAASYEHPRKAAGGEFASMVETSSRATEQSPVEEVRRSAFGYGSDMLEHDENKLNPVILPATQAVSQKNEVDTSADALTKVQESLLKDINQELHNYGEEPMSKKEPMKAVHGVPETTQKTEEKSDKSGNVSHPEGFEALLARQTLVRGSVHLKTNNPWRELSGSRGQYSSSSKRNALFPSVEMWSHHDVPASIDFKFPFCRLYGACRSKSGRILLPKNLLSQKTKLARCGILSEGNFVLGDREAEAAYMFVREADGAQIADMDLVERHAPRRGAAHFLADSLKILFFMDALHGAGARNDSLLQKLCLDSNGDHDGSCIVEQESEIHPVMFIRKESFVDDVWVPHYMKMLASGGAMGGHAPLRFLNQYSLYPPSKDGEPEAAACFRSITTSAYMYGQVPGSALTAKNPFFSGNRISRLPVQPRKYRDSEPQRSTIKLFSCQLRVKLSDHLTGDSAVNLHEMAKILNEKTGKASKDSNISLMLVLPAKETLPFSMQVKHMQETDILVAPHGSPLTDTIFMRPGTSVVEVHPFSYLSGMFQGISHQLGQSHSKLSAEPDVKIFEPCLSRYNSGPEADAIPQLVSKMQTAAEQYKLTGKTPLHLEESSLDFRLVHDIKQCARRQRMRLDPEKLAAEIWSQAKQMCNLF